MRKVLERSERFQEPPTINELAAKAEKIVSLGNRAGEGWLLTVEMLELLDSGVHNIVCTQPFACLPNHVTGKVMLKTLSRQPARTSPITVATPPGDGATTMSETRSRNSARRKPSRARERATMLAVYKTDPPANEERQRPVVGAHLSTGSGASPGE